jgi:hypothetical protein
LVKWKTLAKPKKCGRWGLKNISLFGEALPVKSLWRLLFSDGMWSKLMKQKYFHDHVRKVGVFVSPETLEVKKVCYTCVWMLDVICA